MTHYLGAETSRDYHIVKALIKSPQAILDIDVSSLISEIDIFENIDTPYLTGNLIIVDTGGIMEGMNFQGGETFELELSRSVESAEKPTVKTFVIDSVISGTKVNESSELLQFHIVEDIAFMSTLQNVNKTLTGQPYEMIKSLATEYLGKECESTYENNVQSSMRIIIPNLTPMDTLLWIKNRSFTTNGFPFYLYSTFTKNELQFRDLESIISSNVINEDTPFVYLNNEGDATARLFKIHDFSYKNAENVNRMIRSGVVGGTHSFYNVHNMTFKKVKFNVHDDMFSSAMELQVRQNLPNLSKQMKWDDVCLSDYNSVNFSSLTDGKVFQDKKSYNQEKTTSDYKKRIVGASVKNFMTKQPIEITIDGREFLDGVYDFTIGNNIKIIFKTNYDFGEATPKIDSKRSGDYTVFAARHVFQNQKYFVKLLCGKLMNYNNSDYPEGAI